MRHKVLGWLGFRGQSQHPHAPEPHGHGPGHSAAAHGQAHTHGVRDPVLATTTRGIWAIKWSFVILAVTAALQLGIVLLSGSVALSEAMVVAQRGRCAGKRACTGFAP